jgi:uncharacterized protein YbjT (DUF2867 family)
MTPAHRVVVFSGTGFLGRRVVRHLLDHDFAVRIATRHPERSRGMFAGKESGLESIKADVNEDRSLPAAVRDAFAMVNAVKPYGCATADGRVALAGGVLQSRPVEHDDAAAMAPDQAELLQLDRLPP